MFRRRERTYKYPDNYKRSNEMVPFTTFANVPPAAGVASLMEHKHYVECRDSYSNFHAFTEHKKKTLLEAFAQADFVDPYLRKSYCLDEFPQELFDYLDCLGYDP